jgi:hypothetical protein
MADHRVENDAVGRGHGTADSSGFNGVVEGPVCISCIGFLPNRNSIALILHLRA